MHTAMQVRRTAPASGRPGQEPSRIASPISTVPTSVMPVGHDVPGAQALVEHGGDRRLERGRPRRPCRRNSAGTWRRRRSWRSGWRCPGRQCRAPSRAPARRAPCACRSCASGAPSEAEGSMPIEPVSMAAMSDSMSPNRLSVTMTSNCLGQRTSCMPPASASMWSSLTSAYFALCVCGDDLVPQHARLHDVALFHRGDVVLAGARQLEGDARNALDLERVVDLRVDAALLAVAEVDDLLRLAEIDAAGQLAHDQDVEALDDLLLQRGRGGERRVADGGAQIGEEFESLRSRSRPASGRTS